MTAVSQKELPGIVLVGDDPSGLEQARVLLQDAGICPSVTCFNSREILKLPELYGAAVIVIDIAGAWDNGARLQQIRSAYPEVRVIIASERCDVEFAVDCMKSGAVDFIVKPIDADRLIKSVESALRPASSQQGGSLLKEVLRNDQLKHPDAFAVIKTTSQKMHSIFKYTETVSSSDQPILITGETGVGKELFAHAIHRISGVGGQFVSINVAGLDDAMFSDTLFGHRKSAFTGADQYRDGLVSKAGMGTLFLDEIGDLNELSQVKLLRLLQEREYYPVGADQVKICSARIVLATNVNLQERIKEGRFRRDLYFRLCTHQLHIPALRERREDLPVLLENFVEESARHFGKSAPGISTELIQGLSGYDFPGNVRELQARVRDAVARNRTGTLSTEDFPGISCPVPQKLPVDPDAFIGTPGGILSLFGRLPTFREIEDYLIVEALKQSAGNYAVAASMLGVARQTVSKRIKLISSISQPRL